MSEVKGTNALRTELSKHHIHFDLIEGLLNLVPRLFQKEGRAWE
jgi:hypothetical protein